MMVWLFTKPTLFAKCEEKDWNGASSLLDNEKDKSKLKESIMWQYWCWSHCPWNSYDSVLHLACRGHPKKDSNKEGQIGRFVEKLLGVCQDLGITKEMVTMKTSKNLYPIHVACKNGASHKVLELLVQASKDMLTELRESSFIIRCFFIDSTPFHRPCM